MADLLTILQDAAQRAKLPAGMRNNNPGNIKFVGQKIPGIVGPSVNTDQGDPQAVFDSPESGMRAMYSLLGKKYAGGKLTPNQMIAGNMGWTPGNYDAAANVAKYAGIGPNDDIGLSDPRRAATFMRALMRQEHGNSSSLYTDDMIARAVGGAPLPVNNTPGTMAAAGPADGPKGQEMFPRPVMGSMMASASPASDIPPPKAALEIAGVTKPSKGIADIFSLMALQQSQSQAPQPVQIQGPSPEQSQALLNLLKNLNGRTV
jgi:hypothetical protein